MKEAVNLGLQCSVNVFLFSAVKSMNVGYATFYSNVNKANFFSYYDILVHHHHIFREILYYFQFQTICQPLAYYEYFWV